MSISMRFYPKESSPPKLFTHPNINKSHPVKAFQESPIASSPIPHNVINWERVIYIHIFRKFGVTIPGPKALNRFHSQCLLLVRLFASRIPKSRLSADRWLLFCPFPFYESLS